MESVNVLIVDDSLVIRGMLTNILESDKGVRVVGAVSNTADADGVIAHQIVDVVTLDVEMPGTSGLDYLPTLVRRGIPTIILSSRASDESGVKNEAISKGAASCFDKANAVRDALILLKNVKAAALKKNKVAISVAPLLTEEVLTEAQGEIFDRLLTEHGEGLVRFIAEQIGYSMLQKDMPKMRKWLDIGKYIPISMKLPSPL